MRLLAGLAVLLALTAGPLSRASAGEWSGANGAAADQLVGKLLRNEARQGVAPPAVSLGISIGGSLVHGRGYGTDSAGMPVDEATVYHIGSITKQFTAAALLDLIDAGAAAPLSRRPLSLDTDIREVFEGIDHWNADGLKPITMRRLATMTSNLPNFTRRPPEDADPWGAIEARELLSKVKRMKPSGWPDTFEYSNTSYFLLAEAVETVASAGLGHPVAFRDYLRQHLFPRAGLSATGFQGKYAPGKQVAQPMYRRRPAFKDRDWLLGSADMASNILDLNAWNSALMQGRILRLELLDHMFSDGGRVGPTEFYGMGWFIEHKGGRDIYRHSGSVPGYTSLNMIVRRPASADWVSVTILASSDGVEGLEELAVDLASLAMPD